MNKVKELWDYREMLFRLVQRDLKSRYQGSALGFIWMLLNPLLQLGVYTVVFSVIIRMDIEKYYLFLFIALVPWMFFSSCLGAGSSVILGQKDLVCRVSFPREILPVAFTVSQLVNLLFSFLVIFVIVVISGVSISIPALVLLPVVVLIEFVLGLGTVLLVSSLAVYFRDLEHILMILSMVWMYLTPVLYPPEYVPDTLLRLLYLNPMTSVTIAYRDILYYGRAPELVILLRAAGLAMLVLAVGELFFSHFQKKFAEEL